MLLILLLAAAPALAAEPACARSDFPSVSVSSSPERQEAVEACTRLILADPTDPRPYYYRAAARYVGPLPLLGWDEPPTFDIRVADDPDPVIQDYEQALSRATRGRPIPDAGLLWLRLGYLQASKGAWQEAVRAWRRAARFPGNGREVRMRLHFGQARLISPDRLMASPPRGCEELKFWDCAFVRGCTLVLAPGQERSFKGCEGKPMGIEPDIRPAQLDCSLLDETFCGQTPRCRWRGGLLRRSVCVAP